MMTDQEFQDNLLYLLNFILVQVTTLLDNVKRMDPESPLLKELAEYQQSLSSNPQEKLAAAKELSVGDLSNAKALLFKLITLIETHSLQSAITLTDWHEYLDFLKRTLKILNAPIYDSESNKYKTFCLFFINLFLEFLTLSSSQTQNPAEAIVLVSQFIKTILSNPNLVASLQSTQDTGNIHQAVTEFLDKLPHKDALTQGIEEDLKKLSTSSTQPSSPTNEQPSTPKNPLRPWENYETGQKIDLTYFLRMVSNDYFKMAFAIIVERNRPYFYEGLSVLNNKLESLQHNTLDSPHVGFGVACIARLLHEDCINNKLNDWKQYTTFHQQLAAFTQKIKYFNVQAPLILEEMKLRDFFQSLKTPNLELLLPRERKTQTEYGIFSSTIDKEPEIRDIKAENRLIFNKIYRQINLLKDEIKTQDVESKKRCKFNFLNNILVEYHHQLIDQEMIYINLADFVYRIHNSLKLEKSIKLNGHSYSSADYSVIKKGFSSRTYHLLMEIEKYSPLAHQHEQDKHLHKLCGKEQPSLPTFGIEPREEAIIDFSSTKKTKVQEAKVSYLLRVRKDHVVKLFPSMLTLELAQAIKPEPEEDYKIINRCAFMPMRTSHTSDLIKQVESDVEALKIEMTFQI